MHQYHTDLIHKRVIHSLARSRVAAGRGGHDAGAMTEIPNQQSWIPHLDAATGTLHAATTTPADLYKALALTWHTSVAITEPASVYTELGWMRLAEALHTAWGELATVIDPPTVVPFGANTPSVTGPLDDTGQLREAVACLVHATAAALRTYADRPLTVDTGLIVAGIAVDLAASIEGWP